MKKISKMNYVNEQLHYDLHIECNVINGCCRGWFCRNPNFKTHFLNYNKPLNQIINWGSFENAICTTCHNIYLTNTQIKIGISLLALGISSDNFITEFSKLINK